MANICTNMFYAYSETIDNLNCIKQFIKDTFNTDLEIKDNNFIEDVFESKWTFPKKEMDKLFSIIPHKEDIYMRCLSYEFGCMYHALHTCSWNGWEEN